MREAVRHSVPSISSDDIDAVVAVLESRHLEDGNTVREFETEMACYLGRKHALASSSGFSAIHLALIGLGVGLGDEVILPSYCCPAVLNPVVLQQAVPVVVDIGENSFNISVERVRGAITRKTKAVVVPHMFGFPARIDEIGALGIPVIEDCAQSIGGVYKGRKLGSFSVVAVLSFYASKVLCCGDGGMLVTDDSDIYARALNHRYYGHKRQHGAVAYNYHLTNLPAALGMSQLKKLNQFVQARKRIAEVYDSHFAETKSAHIAFENRDQSIFYRYPVEIQRRDAVKEELAHRGIFTGYGVLEGLHEYVSAPAGVCANTESRLESIVSLPIYPSLTAEVADEVAREVVSLLARQAKL